MQHPTKQAAWARKQPRLNWIFLITAACAAVATGVSAVAAGPDRHNFPIAVADLEARHSQMFDHIDSNSDGDITLEEFAAARGSGDWSRRWRDGVMRYREHGYNRGHGDRGEHRANRGADREEIEADIFALLDTDDDGQLSAAEHSSEKQHAARKKVAATRTFEHLDADANGILSAQEFPPNRLQNLDADGDGAITREEMRNGMRKRHADAS